MTISTPEGRWEATAFLALSAHQLYGVRRAKWERWRGLRLEKYFVLKTEPRTTFIQYIKSFQVLPYFPTSLPPYLFPFFRLYYSPTD